MSALLESIVGHARNQPDTVALQSATDVVTYRCLRDEINRVADFLHRAKIQRLGLLGENSIDWIFADIGARAAGILLVPLPTFFSRTQLEHIIETAGLDAILVDDALSEWLVNTTAQATKIGNLHLVRRAAKAIQVPSGTAKITFTSGSTGKPKGVLLTSLAMDLVTTSLLTALRPVPLKNHLCVLPLSTLLENVAGVYVSLMRGTTVTVASGAEVGLQGSSQFDASALLRAIHACNADSIILTPQLLKALTNTLQITTQIPSGLRFVAVGGGHVSRGLVQQARAVGLPVYEGYGLSECSSVVSLNTPDHSRDGSCGKPLAHANVRIVDGEIIVSGDAGCIYLGDSASASADIATGDLGHLDKDGFLFITGRRKNLLITSYGRNISPEWIESEMLENPAILQCMVFGENRPHLGALLFTRVDADDALIADAIEKTNQRLPDYARIRIWHRLSQPFSTANGLLTENLRLKRDAIGTQFEPLIDSLYDSAPAAKNTCRQ